MHARDTSVPRMSIFQPCQRASSSANSSPANSLLGPSSSRRTRCERLLVLARFEARERASDQEVERHPVAEEIGLVVEQASTTSSARAGSFITSMVISWSRFAMPRSRISEVSAVSIRQRRLIVSCWPVRASSRPARMRLEVSLTFRASRPRAIRSSELVGRQDPRGEAGSATARGIPQTAQLARPGPGPPRRRRPARRLPVRRGPCR